MDRQIYQLDLDGSPLLTDVVPSQAADGSVEAKKTTWQQIKDLFGPATLPYKSYTASVLFGGGFVVTAFHTDFGATTFTFSNPFNGVVYITANASIFTTNKTAILCNSLEDGGTPYLVVPQPVSATQIALQIFKYDGTQSATPFFSTFFIEIRVYT